MSSVIKDEIEVEMTPEQKLAFEGFIDVMVEIYKMTSNKIVHNLTYKDYMEKNSLTDDQKEVLKELMSADTSTLYGSGAIGAQVAQMAMTKVGCGYSQDKRMQERWYDCSSLVYDCIKRQG